MTTPTLLLIHGLGATNGVWADVLAELDWPSQVINVELPGHGAAAPSDDYTVGAMAAQVATACANGEEVIAVGHSLGGAVALCLASGFFRPVVTAAVGLGIKLAWSDADVEGMARVAAKGARWFETRDEAVERFLLQAGLRGVGPNHPAVANAVIEVDGQWRVTQDPKHFCATAGRSGGPGRGSELPSDFGRWRERCHGLIRRHGGPCAKSANRHRRWSQCAG